MSMTRRLSRIFGKEKEGPPPEAEKGPRVAFELVKINKYGVRQSRSLQFSESGVANMKGKTCQWYFPAEDIYAVEKDKINPCKLELKVIRRYQFETNSGKETTKIVELCKQLYSSPKSGNASAASTTSSSTAYVSTPRPSSTVDSPGSPTGTGGSTLDLNGEKKISIDSFELIKVLGKGSFSRVVLVRKKDDKKLYAMKILLKSELKKRNQVEHTNTERQILSNYTHPFIVKLYYSFQTADKLYMCIEYVSGGELFFHLKRARRFPENLACFYAAEVVLALEFLHSHQIVYRDLKPENILLDSEGHLKLTDFGLSKLGITSVGGASAEGSKTRTFCGTPDYLAPEIISGLPHGKAVDYWGLGVLLYEMLTGQPPFKGNTRNELYEQTLKAEVSFPEHVSQQAKSIVSQLLAKKPETRLGAKGADELKQHPFFEKINWEKLLKKEMDPPFKPIVVENPLTLESTNPNLSKLEKELILPQGSLKSSSPSFQGFSYAHDGSGLSQTPQ